MVDHHQGRGGGGGISVCSMCGDVGFPDKLFRCNKCRYRLQHSYCSNYYSEFGEPIEQCDWCLSEERNVGQRGAAPLKSGKHCSSSGEGTGSNRSEYAGGDRIKQHDHQHHHHQQHHPHQEDVVAGGESNGGRGGGKSASPRTATRRYKLLKDVMC